MVPVNVVLNHEKIIYSNVTLIDTGCKEFKTSSQVSESSQQITNRITSTKGPPLPTMQVLCSSIMAFAAKIKQSLNSSCIIHDD